MRNFCVVLLESVISTVSLHLRDYLCSQRISTKTCGMVSILKYLTELKQGSDNYLSAL